MASAPKFGLVPEGRFQGEVLTPDSRGYDEARSVWNGLIDRRPVAVIRCAGVGDVQAGIELARANGLPLAVRGGGHSVAGHGTVADGIVLDLQDLSAVSLGAGAMTVTAGGGATWGQVDAATQPQGRAVPGGVFSRTGIAGLTLGGGYGWIRNAYGFSARSLRDATLVTADGGVVPSVAVDQPELLWALRGGGGNFGVVTSFVFDTHPVPRRGHFLFALHDGSDGAAARGLRLFREFCATAPSTVSLIAMLGRVPAEAEAYPPGSAGLQLVGFAGYFLGDADEGAELLRPLREFGTPVLDGTGEMEYTEVQKAFDEDYPVGDHYYWKSANVTELTDNLIDVLVEGAASAPSDRSTIDLWHVAGVASQPFDGSFLPSRAPFLVSPEANWTAPAEDAANIAWVRSLVTAVTPWSDGSRYLNFAGMHEDGETEISGTFRDNLSSLKDVKRRWDPGNLFRLNQNIKP